MKPLPKLAHAPQPLEEPMTDPPSTRTATPPSTDAPKPSPMESMMSKLVEYFDKRIDELERRMAPVSKMEPGEIVVTRTTHAQNGNPDDPQDKNPCRCADCTPFKIQHWYCSSCRRGPFRFQKTDAGRGPVLWPFKKMQQQRFVTIGHYTNRDGQQETIQEWIYWGLYACSDACASIMSGQTQSDEWAKIAERPELEGAYRTAQGLAAGREESMDAETIGTAIGDDLR